MKKEDLHFGDLVYINSLHHTDCSIGINEAMKSFIGTFIQIEDFSPRYRNCIRVKNPSGSGMYAIDLKDISLEPEVTDEQRIIQVESDLVAKFDENLLIV